MKLTEHFSLEEFVRNHHALANDPPDGVVPVLRQFCEKVLEPLRCARPRAVDRIRSRPGRAPP